MRAHKVGSKAWMNAIVQSVVDEFTTPLQRAIKEEDRARRAYETEPTDANYGWLMRAIAKVDGLS